MSFTLRNYKPEDYEMVREWADQQHWNQGKYDHLAFRVLNKNTFWIGQLDAQPIASLSAAQYDENFAFIGLYIVKPQYRGKGYGIQVWKKTLQHVTAKNIGLEGVIQQQNNYMKSGFKTHHRTMRYFTYGTNQQHVSPFLKDCRDIVFEKLTEYDRKNFPSERKEFLQKWINLPESKAVAFVNNDEIQGYGVIRVSADGYRIGPLFADSFEVGECIFKSLIGSVKEDKKISLDIPLVNKDALVIKQNYKMEQSFECARMYTSGQPHTNFHKTVYGVTSLQFG